MPGMHRGRPAALHRAGLIPALLVSCLISAFALPVQRSAHAATFPDGFRDTLIAGGFTLPIGMAFLPDGRLLVVEWHTAKIRQVRGGTVTTLYTVPGVQIDGCEQGLLGIAVDPGWPARPYVYVHFDEAASQEIRITRYTAGGDLSNTGTGLLTIDGASRRDVLTGVSDIDCRHNGGTLRFGPDGMLYASIGDDGLGCVAQDKTTLRGVILRMNVNGIPAGGGPPPTVASLAAAGNPLINASDPRSRLLWAWGLRNPFRFQIDRLTGTLYIGDVGENTYEELNRAATGGIDFGWPRYEGPNVFDAGCTLADAQTAAIYSWDRTNQPGAAVISGGIYHKPTGIGDCPHCFPDSYEGDLFLGDFEDGFMRHLSGSGNSWSLDPVAGQPNSTDWATGMDAVSDYAVGPDGALWYVAFGGGQIRAILGGGSSGPPPPPPGPGGTLSFDMPYPQPSQGAVTFSYALGADSRVLLEIYDMRGSRVRKLVDATEPGGPVQHVWDGIDDHGRNARSGVYVAKLRAYVNGVGDPLESERRVVLVR